MDGLRANKDGEIEVVGLEVKNEGATDDSDKGLSTGAIVGIVLASLAGVALIALIAICAVRSSKAKKADREASAAQTAGMYNYQPQGQAYA